MGKAKYNSASDRRWQQIFMRIQERKENNRDYDEEKRKRKNANRKNKGFYRPCGFIPDSLFTGKNAVVCKSKAQLREVFNEAYKKYPAYVRHWDLVNTDVLWNSYSCNGVVTVGVCEMEDWWVFERAYLSVGDQKFFESRNYNIVDFYDCCPVQDLGDIRGAGDLSYLLLD